MEKETETKTKKETKIKLILEIPTIMTEDKENINFKFNIENIYLRGIE